MSAHRYGQYKTAAVEQADPVRLVALLYEGALRFTELGRRGIESGDAEAAHHAIMRAYAIVAELLATLDFEKGGEIAMRLEQLYDYVLHLLREANLGKDTRKLDQAETVLRDLAGAWESAFRRGSSPVVGAEQAQSGSAAPDHGEAEAAPVATAVNRDTRGQRPALRKELDLEV
jgi:flagellar secretion chaperone FliS